MYALDNVIIPTAVNEVVVSFNLGHKQIRLLKTFKPMLFFTKIHPGFMNNFDFDYISFLCFLIYFKMTSSGSTGSICIIVHSLFS